MVVVRSVPLSRGKRVPRGSRSRSCRFSWGKRGGPGPSSAGAGTVRLQRRVTEVPRDLAQRTARKDDPPEESGGRRGPWASFPAVSSGSRLRVGTLRAKTSRGPRVGT
ncbi:hypothetical protein NN561_000976 [Cricetulus griseus]